MASHRTSLLARRSPRVAVQGTVAVTSAETAASWPSNSVVDVSYPGPGLAKAISSSSVFQATKTITRAVNGRSSGRRATSERGMFRTIGGGQLGEGCAGDRGLITREGSRRAAGVIGSVETGRRGTEAARDSENGELSGARLGGPGAVAPLGERALRAT